MKKYLAEVRKRNHKFIEGIAGKFELLKFEIPKDITNAAQKGDKKAEEVLELLISARKTIELEIYKLRTEYIFFIKNMFNRHRGCRGELVSSFFLSSFNDVKYEDIERDRVQFDTPYGKRRIDAFYQEKKIAVEAKTGYACNDKKTRNQIKKDAYLLNIGIFSEVILKGDVGSKTTYEIRNRVNMVQYKMSLFA